MEREDALDADPARDLAHGECLPCSPAAARDHDAGEDLNAFLFALTDLHVHTHGISGREHRQAGAQRGLLDFQQHVGHDASP